MKKRYFLNSCLGILFLLFSLTNYSQNKTDLWIKSSEDAIVHSEGESFIPEGGKYFKLNMTSLQYKLARINSYTSKGGENQISVKFPNVKGEMVVFIVQEAAVFQKELQEQYPQIRSYIGVGKNATIRFSVSPQRGLSLTYTSGENLGFIERNSKDNYVVYKKSNKNKLNDKFECLTEDLQQVSKKLLNKTTSKEADDSKLRIYKLALSVTAEYTEYFHGGTVGVGQEAAAKANALAGMNATITRVNGVFERDFAVRLQLIANTNAIIYTDPTVDPYSDYTSKNNWNTELQDNLTATIGEANYDIGHLFGHDGGGGNSGCVACVCVDNSKGSGYTSPSDGIPEGDLFDLDYVAHEMGHQFGAFHTWTTDGDGPNNESFGANLEPGSGSTIMGYAGITTSNVQAYGDDYFHFKSIEQVTTYIKSTSCDVEVALSQNTPTVSAGFDYTIPVSTAFVLTGQGTSDGSTTYCWEQNDLGGNGGVETSNPSPTNATGPMFRSLKPMTSPIRYMPALSSVLNENLSTTWESISSVARDMKFKLTVRDNISGGGQNTIDDMTVTVDDSAGPFLVSSQNSAGIIWNQGATETIIWDVASTNMAPISTSQVNILLSIDGGATFSTLVANTPNDGTQNITVPNTAAPYCRIMIEAVGNIYYAVNSSSFSIDYSVVETCNTYSDSPNMPITDNSMIFDTSDIIVPGDITISAITVSVDVTHTWLSDLLINVSNPDGTTVNLIERACDDNEGLVVTFDDLGNAIVCDTPTTGTIIPSESLALFNGESGDGTWTIGINDNGELDIGILNSWSVEICSSVVTPLKIDEFTFDYFNIYPNPSSGFLNVSLLSYSKEKINILLFDLTGRLISSKNFDSDNHDFEFNYGNVSQGIYILKVVQGKKSAAKQIIVN